MRQHDGGVGAKADLLSRELNPDQKPVTEGVISCVAGDGKTETMSFKSFYKNLYSTM